MAEHHTDNAHDDHDDHGGLTKYLIVFLALLGLTIASFATGSLFAGAEGVDPATKTVGWAVMMAVSCAKALLVMLFFMHLIWEANWKYVLTIPATVMSLLLVMALVPDVGRRYRNYSEERMRYAPEVSLHDSHGDHSDGDHSEADHSEGDHSEGDDSEGDHNADSESEGAGTE